MNQYEDPRTPLGPRARAALDRLEGMPMPRLRCSHLSADSTRLSTRVLLAARPDKVRCTACALDLARAVVQREASNRLAAEIWGNVHTGRPPIVVCDCCSVKLDPTVGWTPVHRDLGPLSLQVWLCGACRDADERDALAAADYIPATATPNGS